jgi:ketosteroid isomerase-like protein
MSQEPVVRNPIPSSGRAANRRTFDEHVAVRFPALATFINAALLRLPPSSPVRQRFVVRGVRRAFAAVNRGDLDLNMAILYDPDVETSWPRGDAFIGDPEGYRTREALRDAYREYSGFIEGLRREPQEVLDFGDRLLVLIDEFGRGPASGATVHRDIGNLLTFRDGRIVRHEEYMHWRDALEAVGLRE